MRLLGVLKRFIDWHGRTIFKENKRYVTNIEPNSLIWQLDEILSRPEKIAFSDEGKFNIILYKKSMCKYTFIRKFPKIALFFSIPKYKVDVEINVEKKTAQLLFRLKGVFRWQNIAFFIATEVVVSVAFLVLFFSSVNQVILDMANDINYFSLLCLFALLFFVLISIYYYYQIAVHKEKYLMDKVEEWIKLKKD